MPRAALLLVLLLLAGCSGGPPGPGPTESTEAQDDPADRGGGRRSQGVQDRFYLRDPDALGLRAPGLRMLNFTTNATIRFSGALLSGTGNTVQWILVVPTNATAAPSGACGPDATWRIKHYAGGLDTLTNQPLGPGDWSLLVHAEKLTNLTLLFNTTTLAPYRVANGTPLGWRMQTLDADTRLDSSGSPYRISFNKTFLTTNRTWFIGHFGVRGDGFAQFREIRSKVEASTGFLCAEHRNEVAQSATGGTAWNSVVVADLVHGDSFGYAGRFESTSALNPRVTARAHVLFVEG